MSTKPYIPAAQLGQAFQQERFVDIYNQTASSFQRVISLEDFIDYAQSFNTGVTEYRCTDFNHLLRGYGQYLWTDSNNHKMLSVAMDDRGVIHRLHMAPYLTYPETDNTYTETTFAMPVKDEWNVFWGGTNHFVNHHYSFPALRYAFDLLIIREGKTFRDNRLTNEQYYAFGKEVIAPADGEVIYVENSIPDNMPGMINVDQVDGNVVVIKHTENEYSVLAHLQQNSVFVTVGESIEKGQVLALCGNSGNSPEPHLHFHVQSAPPNAQGKSIRIRFAEEQEPVQGSIVSHM